MFIWSVVVVVQQAVILTYYTAIGVDIKAMYEGRLSVDIDVPAGKAHLKLSSVTLADNKVFECRVQIPGDDEGKPADTARLVVLGNVAFVFALHGFQLVFLFSSYQIFHCEYSRH